MTILAPRRTAVRTDHTYTIPIVRELPIRPPDGGTHAALVDVDMEHEPQPFPRRGS
jgi:hypothetical protein